MFLKCKLGCALLLLILNILTKSIQNFRIIKFAYFTLLLPLRSSLMSFSVLYCPHIYSSTHPTVSVSILFIVSQTLWKISLYESSMLKKSFFINWETYFFYDLDGQLLMYMAIPQATGKRKLSNQKKKNERERDILTFILVGARQALTKEVLPLPGYWEGWWHWCSEPALQCL